MDKKREEMIQRLTARYVADYYAGRQPQLSDLLSQYPQYADVLAGFVAYYHAMEVDLPVENEIFTPLSQTSRAAYEEATKKMESASVELSDYPGFLQIAADNAHKSLDQLSLEVGLGQDILLKLDQHMIDVATIPSELSRRLAKALHRSVATLEIILGLDKQESRPQLVAERLSDYNIEGQHAKQVRACSFQEAIEHSEGMSDEQKRDWRTVLLQEGLL